MASPEECASRADPARSSPRRLLALHGAGLLDTMSEEAFDALSRLAVHLLDAPVGFLSLVDEHRDFYKSQVGMPEPLASTRELRGRSFCHYAITGDEPLVIADTHADATWSAVPSVASLGVRAYLGVPLRVEGEAIGSFCVVDRRPRAWTAKEVETLVQVSKSAEREIALRIAVQQATDAAGRAEALARAREELLAAVTHDLRTPLQVIGLSTAVLQAVADPRTSMPVTRIASATQLMKQLVDDLLETHAVEHHAARRSLVSAARLLADAAGTMESVSQRAGVRLRPSPDSGGTVSVDYVQLLRVLCNLIGNCIKYCPAGSTVSLQAVELDDAVELSIADDGPGMSPDEHARAFERGWRGAAGAATQDGAGLGLAIVRALVAENDGVVTIGGRQGIGTTVVVRLPRP